MVGYSPLNYQSPFSKDIKPDKCNKTILNTDSVIYFIVFIWEEQRYQSLLYYHNTIFFHEKCKQFHASFMAGFLQIYSGTCMKICAVHKMLPFHI